MIAGNGLRRRSGTSSPRASASSGCASSTPPARATPRSSTSSTSPRAPASARCRWPTWSTTRRPATRCATTAGRVRRVPAGEPGLLLSPVNRLSPFDGYTDKAASEKKLVRNAFKRGRCLVQHRRRDEPAGHGPCRVRRPARRHLPLEGRERGHHPGRGRADRRTTRSRSARSTASRCPAPAAAPGWPRSSCATARSSTARRWPRGLRASCPPTRCRCSSGWSESLAHTSTFKSRKVDLREQAYGADVTDPLYVLAGRDEGYVPFYAEYPREVADGKRPRG